LYGIRQFAIPFYISALMPGAVLQYQKSEMAKLGANRIFIGLLWVG
jgi:hypothetical protein